jgi:hypothetical protein
VAATPSVRIEKSFTFKGGTRLWGNRYHFNGGTPPDASHWNALFDAIVLQEKTIFQSNVTIVSATGYGAGSDVPVASKAYTTAGTFSAGVNDHGAPGEVAALVRYSTSARTTKNHPIYLFNYYHAVCYDNSGGQDKLAADQKAVIETYAGHWITGFSDGGAVTALRASPQGALALGHVTEEWLTHRDFPYTPSL